MHIDTGESSFALIIKITNALRKNKLHHQATLFNKEVERCRTYEEFIKVGQKYITLMGEQ